MRLYTCPYDGHRTVHPDTVGPLEMVKPDEVLSDGHPACDAVHDHYTPDDELAELTEAGEHEVAETGAWSGALVVHLGGDWYRLPDGRDVAGRDTAIAELVAAGADPLKIVIAANPELEPDPVEVEERAPETSDLSQTPVDVDDDGDDDPKDDDDG